jgi:hypothetical protein
MAQAHRPALEHYASVTTCGRKRIALECIQCRQVGFNFEHCAKQIAPLTDLAIVAMFIDFVISLTCRRRQTFIHWNQHGSCQSYQIAPVSSVGAVSEISEPSPRDRTSLLKLRAQQCRFIVSDAGSETIFCGAPTAPASSWCLWHRRLVYTKPPSPRLS